MTIKQFREALLALVPAYGATIGNGRLRQALIRKLGREIEEEDYESARDALIEEGLLVKGQGREGSVRLAEADGESADGDAREALVLESPEPKVAKKATPKKRRLQRQIDSSISAHADQEVLYDQPLAAKDKLRITGPFTVEAVPFPTVLAPDEARIQEEADVAIARSGKLSRQHQWRDKLLRTGLAGELVRVSRGELETFFGSKYGRSRL